MSSVNSLGERHTAGMIQYNGAIKINPLDNATVLFVDWAVNKSRLEEILNRKASRMLEIVPDSIVVFFHGGGDILMSRKPLHVDVRVTSK
jgi:hypothetical protein